MSTYRALLVDYGGVLTTSLHSWLDESCRAVGVDTALFIKHLDQLTPSPFALIETGSISREEFGRLLEPALAASASDGAQPSGMDWLNAIRISEKYLDLAMIAEIERLSDLGVRVVLLSNSWGKDEYPWHLLPTFDATVISGSVGVRKPDRGIYEMAIAAAGVPAHQCVFIDDTAENLPPAEALGIYSLHHLDAAQTLTRLAELFPTGSAS